MLLFIVGAIPGFAQQGVSSPASEPVTLGTTNQTLSVEENRIGQRVATALRPVLKLWRMTGNACSLP